MPRPVAGWSNGRTPDSGSGSRGSSPCPAASQEPRLGGVCVSSGENVARVLVAASASCSCSTGIGNARNDATAQFTIVGDRIVGGVRMGATLDEATTVLGMPEVHRRLNDYVCRAGWRTIELTLLFLDLSNANPCSEGVTSEAPIASACPCTGTTDAAWISAAAPSRLSSTTPSPASPLRRQEGEAPLERGFANLQGLRMKSRRRRRTSTSSG
jgi:hypothetical protein